MMFEGIPLENAPLYTVLVRGDGSAMILDGKDTPRPGRYRRGVIVRVRGRTPFEAVSRARNVA